MGVGEGKNGQRDGGVMIFVWPTRLLRRSGTASSELRSSWNGEVKEKRCNLGPLVTPEERFVRYQAERKKEFKK